MNKPALFFDLDSSLIVTISGDTFPRDNQDWQFNQHVLRGVAQYAAEGWPLIIVTNQGGIEAGFWKESDIVNKLATIKQTLEVYIEGILVAAYFCPSNDKAHPNRKPNAGMLLEAAANHGLDLAASLMVGDMESDRLAALAAGVSYLDIKEFLRTHPGTAEQLRHKPGFSA